MPLGQDLEVSECIAHWSITSFGLHVSEKTKYHFYLRHYAIGFPLRNIKIVGESFFPRKLFSHYSLPLPIFLPSGIKFQTTHTLANFRKHPMDRGGIHTYLFH